MYARAANMFKMAKNWSGMDNSKNMHIQFFYCHDLCPDYVSASVVQLQAMLSARLQNFICKCRTNWILQPALSMLAMHTRRRIPKVNILYQLIVCDRMICASENICMEMHLI